MNKITVKNIEINVIGIGDDDYISLTDIARFKNEEDPNAVIANWLRRVDSLQFLTIWEKLNNEQFKPTDFEGFRSKPGDFDGFKLVDFDAVKRRRYGVQSIRR